MGEEVTHCGAMSADGRMFCDRDTFFGSEACSEEEEDDLEVTEGSFVEEFFEGVEEGFNFAGWIVEGGHRSSPYIWFSLIFSTRRTPCFIGRLILG